MTIIYFNQKKEYVEKALNHPDFLDLMSIYYRPPSISCETPDDSYDGEIETRISFKFNEKDEKDVESIMFNSSVVEIVVAYLTGYFAKG